MDYRRLQTRDCNAISQSSCHVLRVFRALVPSSNVILRDAALLTGRGGALVMAASSGRPISVQSTSHCSAPRPPPAGLCSCSRTINSVAWARVKLGLGVTLTQSELLQLEKCHDYPYVERIAPQRVETSCDNS